MSLVEAVILGIVQGLTEFLPVSSTAHLRIVPALLGWPDPGPAFSAVIQIGTLFAVLVYFRRDLLQTGRAWILETLRGRIAESHDGKLGWMIIVGTVPVVLAGLLLEPYIDTHFRRLTVIAGALIGVGLVLYAAERYYSGRTRRGLAGRPLAAAGWGDAITVGLAQAVALIPGSSRSGVTITAGLLRGLDREAAARFSFLLSIPAVFAAGVYKLYKQRHMLIDGDDGATALIVATVVSAVVGYAAIAFLLRYLRTHSTYLFIGYRLLLGALLLALVLQGKMPDAASDESSDQRPTSQADESGAAANR